MGGRFTKRGFSRCAAGLLYLAGFFIVPSPVRHRPCRAGRFGGGRERATPLFLALVRARGRRLCSQLRPGPSGTPHHLSSGGGPCRVGSLPSTASILAGRPSSQLKKLARQRKPRAGVRSPQLVHWPRRHCTDQEEFYQLLEYVDNVDLNKKLAEWERFYNLTRRLRRPNFIRGTPTTLTIGALTVPISSCASPSWRTTTTKACVAV